MTGAKKTAKTVTKDRVVAFLTALPSILAAFGKAVTVFGVMMLQWARVKQTRAENALAKRESDDAIEKAHDEIDAKRTDDPGADIDRMLDGPDPNAGLGPGK